MKAAAIDRGLDRFHAARVPGVSYTLEEIADGAGITKQAVHYIERTALRKAHREIEEEFGEEAADFVETILYAARRGLL